MKCGMVLLCAVLAACAVGQEAVTLPEGVAAVWDIAKAQREKTATRERICINGLWQWQPAGEGEAIPAGNWGYFKVPGSWPGVSSYMQKDSQQVYAHPAWKDVRMAGVTTAWYGREIEVPANWSKRRITLEAQYVNSIAQVFIDGKAVGQILFPAGELDLTGALQPGKKHMLHLLVKAAPLADVLTAYRDTAVGKQVKGTVAFRGLCGDVWLKAMPAEARIESVRLEPSVRKGELTIDAALTGLAPGKKVVLAAKMTDGAEVRSEPFAAEDLKEGRLRFTRPYKPASMWDLHTPQNLLNATVTLVDAQDKVLDAHWPVRFGFREFWMDGRDFYLNGSRIFLSGIYIDNTTMGAAWASYDGAKETLLRLKSIGINYVYTHHYDCQPGSHLALDEMLRAADDAGVLVGLTQPHFAQYDWKAPDADSRNGYARHAAWYAQVAGSHPSVVFYTTSHNATGYGEDMNPDLLEGQYTPTDGWSLNNRKLAGRAEAIVKRFDASRIVYHHAGGSFGDVNTINFYVNFVPIQEMSEWFGFWSSKGTKPLFTCEYGVPFTWDFAMYRGWWQGKREFGSAAVPWELCISEWHSQFFGDAALKMSEIEKTDTAWEAKQFAAGKGWHRWDYPVELSSSRFEERQAVMARYVQDNWRAFRTWGLSGNSPWEFGHYWRLREGVDSRRREEQRVDWEKLQRPGYSADFVEQRMMRMDVAFGRDDWKPSVAGEALLRNNGPLLAYIAGKSEAFADKTHLFAPGESFEKQLIIVNNSRVPIEARCAWSLGLAAPVQGEQRVAVATGELVRLPLQFTLPANTPAGQYVLRAKVTFSNGISQEDQFPIRVLAPVKLEATAQIALYDPAKQTGPLLDALGVKHTPIEAPGEVPVGGVLVVGKNALDQGALELAKVSNGGRVIVFEQSTAALQKLGYRTVEYGLRQVFARVADHPALAGLGEDHLRDWRGSATLLPPQLKYTTRPMHGPTVKANGVEVSRVWRCGTRGNVASVLIEKPARGDFLPIVVGGFGLQYAPLIEQRQGKGMILWCQLDVSNRSESDPAAQTIASNLIRYAAEWKAAPQRRTFFAGDEAARKHIEAAGFNVNDLAQNTPTNQDIVIIGRGAAVAPEKWAGAGKVIGLGLSEREAGALLKATLQREAYISAPFAAQGMGSPFAGVGAMDLVSRDPRPTALLDGAPLSQRDNAVICNFVPWDFKADGPSNQRRTFRRAAVTLARVLANAGVEQAVGAAPDALYLDTPQEWDDPYRFFRW